MVNQIKRASNWYPAVIVALCLLITVMSLPYVIPSIFDRFPSSTSSDMHPWGEQTQSVVDDTRETTRMLLQTAIATIAGSWVVLVLQPENRKPLSTRWGQFAFVCANICLVSSAVSYVVLSRELTKNLQRSADAALETLPQPSTRNPAATPAPVIGPELRVMPMIEDLNSSHISGFLTSQIAGLFGGALCLGLTLFTVLGGATDEKRINTDRPANGAVD